MHSFSEVIHYFMGLQREGPLLLQIDRCILRWYGHVLTIPLTYFESRTYQGLRVGKQLRGRLLARWFRRVMALAGSLLIALSSAQ